MKPDSTRSMDAVERAHLKDPDDASHVMYRYPADPEFDGFLRRFWIPVWSVPDGLEAPQRVLQYPVSLLVVAAGYARFYGVVPGLSTTTLTGRGWAVGVMCAPAAGAPITGGPMSGYTDRYVDVAEVLGAAGERLSDVAALLGHADQAHFTRDFATVTTMTPGQFAARHAAGS